MMSGNNMFLRFTSMKSSQPMLKQLAAYGLPGQRVPHLHSSNHFRTLDATRRPQYSYVGHGTVMGTS